MKRIISFLVVAMTVIAACFLTSCKKDEAKSTDSLSGTTWVANADLGQYLVKEIINFTSDTNVHLSFEIAGETIESIDGTYTYNKPTVTIKVFHEGQTSITVGTISGNTLSITEDEMTIVFTKQ